MDLATTVILTVIATVGVSVIAFAFMGARRNDEKGIPWDKIRPILSEMFVESVKLMEARALGYEGIEDYSVRFIKRKIDESDYIYQEEKDLVTESFIRTMIRPRLKELYSEKISKKRIGE